MIGPDYAAQNVGGGVTRTIYPLTENDQTDAEQTDTEEPMARPKHIHRWARGNVEEESGGSPAHEQPLEEGTGQDEQVAMPEVHAAAANGNVSALEATHAESPHLLHETDTVGRNALFYACANGQVECARFLISRAPDLCAAPDENGDTPLHAAVSTGCLDCCTLLLQSEHCDPESGNALGMRPSHLAKDRRTIELLCSNGSGVELNCADNQQRTPLFVACAMNRHDVVDFLCEIMDNEDDLNHVDRRGDTPLHAAACNGALLSLTHLLKLGTNPDVRNTKGYRPIDLAARRGHADCETVLSEYHMHHSAGSYFDSVLFLAALQGNKARHEAIDEDSEYEIMRKANPEATDDEIHRMWSLRRSQSMRLQQWASWIAYEDPKVGSVFWYNPRTQKSQWDKPEEVKTLQDSKQSSFKGEWEARKKTSMRLKRISDWIEYHGQGGKTFYYNETTREFQWERPVDLVS